MPSFAKQADEVGYPIMLKASWGGGGRGMRPINNDLMSLRTKVLEGRREAEAAFGNGEGYLEKMIHPRPPCRSANPRRQARAICTTSTSATARSSAATKRSSNARPPPISPKTQREEICELGRKILQAHVNYECAGTVEFLMDMEDGKFYFIEVNPRVQVEHTVTEEVTGIDIVQAQILIAEGKTIAEATGKASQDEVQLQRPRPANPDDHRRPAEQLHPRLWPHHRLPRGHRHGHPS